jgi:hydroxyacylglutathione hydrolase
VAGTLIVPVVDEGLGNSAYLADLGDGRALAVDAPREVRAAAARHGLTVAFAADTHLHADFLSGALQFAADDGAQILASASGGRDFEHTRLADGDEVDLGGLRLRAWATPGHTAEHLAYLLLDGGHPLGVFTGGSLLVGAVARTDLSGLEQAEPLARSQYASVHRLLTLPDATPVYPTHGAGPFCSAPPGADRTTTIGDVSHPAWRARSVGVYRLWRDGGFAVGALLAGVIADAFGIVAAIWVVAGLTAASGLVVAVRMYETRPAGAVTGVPSPG